MKHSITHQEVESLLAKHGVRPTANRITICKALAESANPLSLIELEALLATIDRSGIFRALGVFREHHLVHVIEDGSAIAKYELCLSHDADEADDDAHAHFFCERCGATTCLDEVPVPSAVALPEGYVAHTTNFLIKGLCPKCSFKSR